MFVYAGKDPAASDPLTLASLAYAAYYMIASFAVTVVRWRRAVAQGPPTDETSV